MTIAARPLAALAALTLAASAARAEVGEIKLTRQPGVLYLPVILMEAHALPGNSRLPAQSPVDVRIARLRATPAVSRLISSPIA